jgi:hypothetical protein|tara:strand:+ start:102 stop:521 length:420 start_codon:yes stop_codon:yes gene_type:complete
MTSGMSNNGASNFHSRRLSENKVANIMRDTFTQLGADQYISSGPTKYDAFRSRSKTIVQGKAMFTNNAMAPSPSAGIPNASMNNSGQIMGSDMNSMQQDNLPPSGMMTQSDYFQRELTQQDLENMKSNKYLRKVDSIND